MRLETLKGFGLSLILSSWLEQFLLKKFGTFHRLKSCGDKNSNRKMGLVSYLTDGLERSCQWGPRWYSRAKWFCPLDLIGISSPSYWYQIGMLTITSRLFEKAKPSPPSTNCGQSEMYQKLHHQSSIPNPKQIVRLHKDLSWDIWLHWSAASTSKASVESRVEKLQPIEEWIQGVKGGYLKKIHQFSSITYF